MNIKHQMIKGTFGLMMAIKILFSNTMFLIPRKRVCVYLCAVSSVSVQYYIRRTTKQSCST